MVKNIVILILILISSISNSYFNNKNIKSLTSGLITILISFENYIIGILFLIIIFNLFIVDTYYNEKFRCKYIDDLDP